MVGKGSIIVWRKKMMTNGRKLLFIRKQDGGERNMILLSGFHFVSYAKVWIFLNYVGLIKMEGGNSRGKMISDQREFPKWVSRDQK